MSAEESPDCEVSEECLQELLEFFLKSSYKARTVDRRVRSQSIEFGLVNSSCTVNL